MKPVFLGVNDKITWPVRHIERCRTELAAELAAIGKSQGEKSLRAQILRQISTLSHHDDSKSQLRRFMLCLASLNHQAQHGGLKTSQIHSISEVAFSLLKSAGIKPTHPKLSSLYAEVLHLLAQIFARRGSHWLALWQEHFALELGQDHELSKEDTEITLGYKALRLGFSDIALEHFSSPFTNHSEAIEAKIALAKTYRLQGLLAETGQEILQGLNTGRPISEIQKQDLHWQLMWHDLAEQKDLRPLIDATKPRAGFRSGERLMTVKLAAFAFAETRWLDRLPTYRSMSRDKSLKTKNYPMLARCVQTLEQCYDNERPKHLRVLALGNLLQNLAKLPDVEQELLVWAAAAKWLKQNKLVGLSRIAQAQYQKLSLALSRGESKDAMHLSVAQIPPKKLKLHSLEILQTTKQAS